MALGTCCDSEPRGGPTQRRGPGRGRKTKVSSYSVGLVKGGSPSQVGKEAGLVLLTDRFFPEVGRGYEDFAVIGSVTPGPSAKLVNLADERRGSPACTCLCWSLSGG